MNTNPAACPRDRHALGRVGASGATGAARMHCGHCQGLWLPGAMVIAAVGAPDHRALARSAQGTALACPSDGHGLVAVMHRGVEIDVCPACDGVWLDAGELERILATPASNDRNDVGNAVLDAVTSVPAPSRSAPVRVDHTAGDGASLLESAGDVVGRLLEFVADAFSSL